MTCVEITRQHSKPLLIATWYRPPNSELDIFTNFELFLFKCDMENQELISVGDLNCDVNKLAPDLETNKLQTLCSLYQLTQVINRLRAVPPFRGFRFPGMRKERRDADNTSRNEIRVAHTTQNSHWSKSICLSIKSDNVVIML
jgi:hypothetical protein